MTTRPCERVNDLEKLDSQATAMEHEHRKETTTRSPTHAFYQMGTKCELVTLGVYDVPAVPDSAALHGGVHQRL